MNKAIFIDKDGTLIHDVPYNVNPAFVRLREGTIAGLAKLKDAGFLLIVVTNQSGIAHGYFKEDELMRVQNKLSEMLHQSGIELDGLYYCPHHPAGKVSAFAKACDCRKPKPGMILNAAQNFNIDLSRSWMIGDILHDVEAGNTAGCKTILINNGNETEWHITDLRKPTGMAADLNEAATFVLQYSEA